MRCVEFVFQVQEGGSFDIDYEVLDPSKRSIQSGTQESQGDYVFAATSAGEYAFCFSNTMSTFANKLVDFDVTLGPDPAATESKFRLAKRSALQGAVPTNKKLDADTEVFFRHMEEGIEKLSTTFSHIQRTQKYFQTREKRNFSTVRSTESRIFWFSMLELALMVGMGAGQVYLVRTFFSMSGKSRV